MNNLARAIMRRVVDRFDTTGDLARLPSVYRDAGGGFMGDIAAAGIVRLVRRWPMLAVFAILAMVFARFMSGRSTRANTQPGSAALR